MALLFIDSFDHYDDGESKWRNIAIDSGGRHGSGGLVGAFSIAGRTLPGEFNELLLGMAYKTQSFANDPIAFYNERVSLNNDLEVLHIGDGRLQIIGRRSPVEVSSGSVSTQAMVLNQWYYLELHGVSGSNTVVYELRVNEEPWCVGTLTYTNTLAVLSTNDTGWADVSITGPGGGNLAVFDDLYIKSDGTFLGDVEILCLRPNGTTTLSEWTPFPGTATNYTCVDDTVPNGDTDYVTATATALTDLYEMEDVGAFTGTIFGVQGVQDVKKVDAGEGRTQQVWVDGLTGTLTYTSSEFYPSAVDYLMDVKVLETSPFSTATWSASEVDAIRFGIKRTV